MTVRSTFSTPGESDFSALLEIGNPHQAAPSVLLLGPIDVDVQIVLRRALEAGRIPFFAQGPLLALPGNREQFALIGAILRKQLAPHIQTRIRAAYAPYGVSTMDQALLVMLYAEPLPVFLDNLKHEWVREVLHDDWLFSVFQPIVEAKTGEIFAYEALLRARHPQSQEMIGAGPLVHACNVLHLEHELDQYARRVAIRDASALAIPGVRFFINFVPQAIYHPESCLQSTFAAAEEWNVALNRLVFEVVGTERALDITHLGNILGYCRQQGIGTAIDDMGAGFSSLEYISTLCPDYIKIDGDVISQAEKEPPIHRRLDALIRTAHQQNACIIAEGIETKRQMQFCLELGIDYMQGFLFASPANPPEEVASEPWLAKDAQ